MSACDWVDWCSQNHSSGNVAVEKRTDYPTEIIDVSVHNNTNNVSHRQKISLRRTSKTFSETGHTILLAYFLKERSPLLIYADRVIPA